MILALAGGVGGAKMAQGLYGALPPGELAVLVNTGDDFQLHGLHISPDLDTVMYTLAGLANPATGWGIAGDTFNGQEMMARYGQDAWFRLGDRDLATHILRTEALRNGGSLSQVTAQMAAALGIQARILPMCDATVATKIDTDAGRLEFQDYFVRRHQQDAVRGVVVEGIEQATPPGDLAEILSGCQAVFFCPSNPIVSIGPILAVPGLRAQLEACPAVKVAISPIVGGRALKGPAAQMLQTLGHEVSAYGVARMYQGLVQGMVIDQADAGLAGRIEALGMRVLATHTVMGDKDDRVRLGREVLDFCRKLSELTVAELG